MIHVYWVQKFSCPPTLMTLLHVTCYILDETTQSEVLNNSDNSNCKLNNKLMHGKQGNSH